MDDPTGGGADLHQRSHAALGAAVVELSAPDNAPRQQYEDG